MKTEKFPSRPRLPAVVVIGALAGGCAQMDALTQATVMAECALSAESRALTYALINDSLRRSGRTIRVTEPYCGAEPEAQFLTRLQLMLR